MNRNKISRKLAWGLIAALFMGLGYTARAAQPDNSQRPNLLFVFPDQWRGQALGFLGEEPVQTPVLDRMSKEALVLTHAISNAPQCVPYRAMLMSGMYPHSNGILCNCYGDKTPRHMKPSVVWWSDILAGQGYELGYVGKWHLPPKRFEYQGEPLEGIETHWVPPEARHSFKYWYHLTSNSHGNAPYWGPDNGPKDSRKTHQWTPIFEADRIIDFLRNEDGAVRDPAKPFAMVWSANPPHMPYHSAPEEYKKLYENVDVEDLCRPFPNIPPKGEKWGDYYRKNIKGYYAQMTGVDAEFGRVLACLEEQGLADNTIVVFTSDHGDCLGRHNYISKNNHYQESIAVPCLIRWPGKIKPRRDNLLFNTPDFYPTMLSLLGLQQEIPDATEGVDYARLFLEGEGKRPTSQLYTVQGFNEAGKGPSMGERGIRTQTHTLMVRQMKPKDSLTVFLHDNIADPYQMKNLADEQPELVQQLIKEELRPWLERTKDPWLTKAQPFPPAAL